MGPEPFRGSPSVKLLRVGQVESASGIKCSHPRNGQGLGRSRRGRVLRCPDLRKPLTGLLQSITQNTDFMSISKHEKFLWPYKMKQTFPKPSRQAYLERRIPLLV